MWIDETTGFWTVRHFGSPRLYLLNQERKDSHYARAKHVKYWREAFALEAMVSDLPRPIPGPVHIGVAPYVQHNYKQDLGACFPTAKAAIDGLVDAGFLPHDGVEWVRMLSFCPPIIGQQKNGLILYVRLTTA